jgi:hypothetical protein
MSAVKIPKQLYVVATNRTEHDWAKGTAVSFTLGFLHPHEPGKKADVLRKSTQHEWAYSGYGTEYQTDSGEWYHKGVDYTLDNQYQRIATPYDRPIPVDVAPRIWENEPLHGFEIIDTVNRYRGNKLFKVMDPRGVMFEITVAALFVIIQNGTIEKSIIKNACVWKGNKNLVIAD